MSKQEEPIILTDEDILDCWSSLYPLPVNEGLAKLEKTRRISVMKPVVSKLHALYAERLAKLEQEQMDHDLSLRIIADSTKNLLRLAELERELREMKAKYGNY